MPKVHELVVCLRDAFPAPKIPSSSYPPHSAAMPPKPEDVKRLESSKMSFPEHLEELRSALFKSIVAWFVGTLLGLSIGWQVVEFVQTPLQEALLNYYQGQATQSQLKRFDEQAAAGEEIPDDPQAAAEQLAREGNLLPEVIYIDPVEWARANGAEVPERAGADYPTSREDLIRLPIYRPLEEDSRLQTISTGGQESFMVYMKASLVVGALIASPFIFYYLWNFVAAGLYSNERNMVYMFMPMSLGLFLGGAALAFFAVFDYVLNFLLWFNEQMGIQPMPKIDEWMSFVLILPLGFGISFQMPLVMLLLERVGVFTIESYLSKWRVAVVVICASSMFLTPADPGSMILMAVPLVFLYFGGILLCIYMPRSQESG